LRALVRLLEWAHYQWHMSTTKPLLAIITTCVITSVATSFAFNALVVSPLLHSKHEASQSLRSTMDSQTELETGVFELSLGLSGDTARLETASRVDADTMSFSSPTLNRAFDYPRRWGRPQSISTFSSASAFQGGTWSLEFTPPGPAHPVAEGEASPTLEAFWPDSSRHFLFWTGVESEAEARRATMMTTADPSTACRSFAALSRLHGECHIDETGAMSLDFVDQEEPLGGGALTEIVGTVWFLPLGEEDAPFRGALIRYTMIGNGDPHQQLTWFRLNLKTPGLIAGVRTMVQSWRGTTVTGS